MPSSRPEPSLKGSTVAVSTWASAAAFHLPASFRSRRWGTPSTSCFPSTSPAQSFRLTCEFKVPRASSELTRPGEGAQSTCRDSQPKVIMSLRVAIPHFPYSVQRDAATTKQPSASPASPIQKPTPPPRQGLLRTRCAVQTCIGISYMNPSPNFTHALHNLETSLFVQPHSTFVAQKMFNCCLGSFTTLSNYSAFS